MAGDPSSALSPARLPYAGFGWRTAASAIREHLPRQLVTSERRNSVLSFAERLPMEWYWGMFETRLTAQDDRVDLLGALVQNKRTRHQLSDALQSPHGRALHPAKSALQAWSRNDGTLFASSPNFWFEWDQDRPDSAALNWLCLAPEFFDKSAESLSLDDVTLLVEQFLSSEPALAVTRGALRTFRNLANALPRGGQLMSFASLKPRGRDAYRVFVRLPRGRTKEWLSAVGWPGNMQELDEVLPLFDVDGEDQWCQIEFSDHISPYLALELAQTERGFPNRDARERWLNHAVDAGWATEDKANAVLDWHGISAAELPSHPDVKLLRSFHLKLALAPDRSPEAKAYLGFYFRKPKAPLVA